MLNTRRKLWAWLIAWTLVVLGLGWLGQLFIESTMAAKRTSLLSNVVQCARASLLYADDHDDKLPLAANWQTAVEANQNIAPGIFLSVAPRGAQNPPEYIAFRAKLSGDKVSTIKNAAQTVLTFDSVITNPNAYGELDQMPDPPRWNYGGKQSNVVAFADGHAKSVTKADPIH